MDEKACIKGKVSKGLSNEAAKKKCAEETKNTLSPSIKDLKEVHIEEPMVKSWDFDPDSILKSTRKVTGTFHVPKVDKDREIITKAAMTDAIPDFMHLPILHDFHKERVLGLVTKVWEEADAFHTSLDFLLYHRLQGGIENPKEGKPKYLMFSLSEEEYIGGEELADAIEQCKRIGLELLLAICDRETSVTYYAVKRIEVPGSKYEYYEIEWEQP